MQIKCLTPSSSISVFFFFVMLSALWPAPYRPPMNVTTKKEEIMKEQNKFTLRWCSMNK